MKLKFPGIAWINGSPPSLGITLLSSGAIPTSNTASLIGAIGYGSP